MRLRFLLSIAFCHLMIPIVLLADVSSNAGKLLISEVALKASTDWVELYVKDGSVDWSGYRLHRGSDTYAFTIPSDWITNGLTTGDYIVIHFISGTDDNVKSDNNPGYWDGYTTGDLQGTDYIIQIKEPSGSTKRVDCVIWANGVDGFTSSAVQANEAVSDGMWNSYDFSSGDAGAWTDSDLIGSGNTLARYGNISGPGYIDTNHKNDWYRSDSPSPGGLNDSSLPLTLNDFSAVTGEHDVKLTWSTESEINVLGFFICRSETEKGQYQLVNPSLIPGHGNCSTRNDYYYIDRYIDIGVSYWYLLKELNTLGDTSIYGPIEVEGLNNHSIDEEDALLSNYPNPFNPETMISYIVSGEESDDIVQITIYNVLGEKIRTLVSERQNAGRYQISWNGCDENGIEVSCGIYFCKMMITNKICFIRKLLKVK